MLALKANKKLVQNHISTVTGKNVLLKDLHNMASDKLRSLAGTTVEDLINELQSKPGISILLIKYIKGNSPIFAQHLVLS